MTPKIAVKFKPKVKNKKLDIYPQHLNYLNQQFILPVQMHKKTNNMALSPSQKKLSTKQINLMLSESNRNFHTVGRTLSPFGQHNDS